MKRKTKSIYNFSVEGQCEELYLKHLEKLIHESNQFPNEIIFFIKQEKSPKSYVKINKPLDNSTVYHIFDYEGIDPNDKNKFEKTLNEIKEANNILPSITYNYAYSNICFELWIILHKKDCNKPMSYPKDYLSEINDAYHTKFESLKKYKEKKAFDKLLQSITLDNVKEAVQRSKTIMKNRKTVSTPINCNGYSYYKENPSLSIWECIDIILSECKTENKGV